MEVAGAAGAEGGDHGRTTLRRIRDAWTLGALFFLLAASFTAFFGWNTRQVDAKAYWDGGTRLRTGVALYATEPVPALAKAYLYPPAFAAFIAPLTALPPLWGYAVWMALQIAFAVALARVCAALAGIGRDDGDGRRTALALALGAGLAPLSESIGEGQANLVIALLCALAVLAVERGHDRRAAFALAAAAHIKLIPIVLAGAFLAWGRRRVVAWLAGWPRSDRAPASRRSRRTMPTSGMRSCGRPRATIASPAWSSSSRRTTRSAARSRGSS